MADPRYRESARREAALILPAGLRTRKLTVRLPLVHIQLLEVLASEAKQSVTKFLELEIEERAGNEKERLAGIIPGIVEAAPVSTIDPNCPSGAEIPIEERSANEVTEIGGMRVAPEGIQVRQPAFDVTPARLINAIITDRGILRSPYEEAIRYALRG